MSIDAHGVTNQLNMNFYSFAWSYPAYFWSNRCKSHQPPSQVRHSSYLWRDWWRSLFYIVSLILLSFTESLFYLFLGLFYIWDNPVLGDNYFEKNLKDLFEKSWETRVLWRTGNRKGNFKLVCEQERSMFHVLDEEVCFMFFI